MADWIIRCAELFKPLYDWLHQHLIQQPVIQADETTLKVVDSGKSTSYMWLYATGVDSPQATITGSAIHNIVLYDYHNSRAGQCAWTSLAVITVTCKWMAIRAMNKHKPP